MIWTIIICYIIGGLLIGFLNSIFYINLDDDPKATPCTGDIDLLGKRWNYGDSDYILETKRRHNQRIAFLGYVFWPIGLAFMILYGLFRLFKFIFVIFSPVKCDVEVKFKNS